MELKEKILLIAHILGLGFTTIIRWKKSVRSTILRC